MKVWSPYCNLRYLSSLVDSVDVLKLKILSLFFPFILKWYRKGIKSLNVMESWGFSFLLVAQIMKRPIEVIFCHYTASHILLILNLFYHYHGMTHANLGRLFLILSVEEDWTRLTPKNITIFIEYNALETASEAGKDRVSRDCHKNVHSYQLHWFLCISPMGGEASFKIVISFN